MAKTIELWRHNGKPCQMFYIEGDTLFQVYKSRVWNMGKCKLNRAYSPEPPFSIEIIDYNRMDEFRSYMLDG